LDGGQGQREGAGQHAVEHEVGEGGPQAQGDPPASDCWPTEWYLPAMETVPVALTDRHCAGPGTAVWVGLARPSRGV
jgi:hypothetical protein